MKKITIWGLLFLLAGILSCKKEAVDLIEGHTPDQRLSIALKQYKAKLTSAPYGWILIESTTGNAVNHGVTKPGPRANFAYFLEFSDSDRVSMYSDFSADFAGTPQTSSYHVSALQRPSLVFDTYSYIHIPCDPDPRVSKSPFGSGMGWGADFEFSFADNTDPANLGDTIHLTGNLNRAAATMIKATRDQMLAYHNGQLQATMQAFATGIQQYFKRGYENRYLAFEMTPGLYGPKTLEVSFCDPYGNILGNQIYSAGCYFTPGSLHFNERIGPLTSIDDIVYDAGTNSITCSYNGSGYKNGKIGGNTRPLQVFLDAPKQWWTMGANAGAYYYSVNGFHKNGIDDYYGFSNAKGWMYFLYWPRYGRSGTSYFDIFGTAFNSSITGGVLIQSFQNASMVDTSKSQVRFTNDGRIRFLNGRPFGNYNYPAFTGTLADLTDSIGFYIVPKLDGKSSDMVGAADAKKWMHWDPVWLR